MEQCKKYVKSILEYVHAHKQDVPEKLYKETLGMASAITFKMRAYGDAMTGKRDPTMVSMLIQHFKIVENLRHTQPEKYKQLVFFATIYPTLDPTDQTTQLETFFKGF